ncbi:Stemmadenine O-acetyltransferase [Linum perenne]
MIKLSLLDQLTPTSYSPLILFYPNNNKTPSSLLGSARLRWSLSQALSLYYPLSGRVRDNFTIHDFHEGVPFIENRVSCNLHSFLGGGGHQTLMLGSLNNLLPLPPFCKAPDSGPLLAVKMSMFECGGLALGCCFSHKTADAATASAFLKTWSTINGSGQLDNVVEPSFEEGSLTFPPMKSMHRDYVSLTERLWFGSKSTGRRSSVVVTRRFVFDGESLAKLKVMAKSEMVTNPSRAEAVSAFIWKSLISASDRRPSVLTQSVDLRRLTRPRLSENSFGNFVLFSDSKYDPSKCTPDMTTRVDVLVDLIRTGVNDIRTEYVKWMSSSDDQMISEAIFDYYDRQEEIEDEDMDVYNFSCWPGSKFNSINFGWGPSIWAGLAGPMELGGVEDGDSLSSSLSSSCYSNSVVLIENGRGKGGIEAWLSLDEQMITTLEHDPEFSEFASSKFAILPPLCSRI